jgi:hypothetical protein
MSFFFYKIGRMEGKTGPVLGVHTIDRERIWGKGVGG